MGGRRTKLPQDYAENTKKGSAKGMGPPGTFGKGKFIRICRMTLASTDVAFSGREH